MTHTTHNGIQVVIFDEKESKIINFYEKNKNKQVSEVAISHGITTFEVKKLLERGKFLKEA